MTQQETLRRLKRTYQRSVEGLLKDAYQQGFDAGLTRAHGQGRRGRTIRGDATVAGLVRRIERHFGLGRFRFKVRIVHESGRRVPETDLLRKYPQPEA